MARPSDSSGGVFLDACFLYPNLVRGIILRLAEAGLIDPRWSPRVLAEWRIAAARGGGLAAEAAVEAIARRMAATFPHACGTPDPGAEQTLALRDPADTHVLAGAIAAGAGELLTFNMRDFPTRRLAPHGATPRHPDGFLWEIFSRDGVAVGRAARETAAEAGLTDANAIRRALKRAHLPRFAKAWFAQEGGAGRLRSRPSCARILPGAQRAGRPARPPMRRDAPYRRRPLPPHAR